MSFIQDEIILPFSVISLVAGYQLAVFFLYQYFKLKDENIELNKILLAYALFFLFAISGALLRVLSNYFLLEISYKDILLYLSFIVFILAPNSFLLIVSTKPFHQVSDPRIPRIIILITIISLILTIIISSFVEFPYILLFVLLGYAYLLFFQYKLIKLSTGRIKRRLKLILIGEVILSVAILIGNNEFRTIFLVEYKEILLLISMPFVMLSLLIIYFGVYKFPVFLEFDWKKKIIHFFVIKENPIEKIYSFDFKTVLDNSNSYQFTEVMSRVIVGVEDIVSEITYIKDVKTNIIKKGDITFVLEYSSKFSEPLIFVLVVNGEGIESFKYFLKLVKKQFQAFFKEILMILNEFKGGEKKLFESFDIILNNLML